MELNREQIIKALECHASGKIDNCIHCPYNNIDLKYDETCAQRMLGDAILLIKELTEENERLSAEKEAENKELFHKWKKIADETADRYEGLYQDAKKSLVASTVRKMQERLIAEFRKDDRMNYYLRMTLDQIAKEVLEVEKGETANEN